MNTRKEISTIGYQSKDFIVERLNELIQKHTICDYMMIWHFAEEDESRPHWHIWIEPNTLIDTMDLQEYLLEVDFDDPKKSNKCIKFEVSQYDDWIPYALHDPVYLALKKQSRKYHYTPDQIIRFDDDSFEYMYHHAFNASVWAQDNIVTDRILESFNDPFKLIQNRTVGFRDAGHLRNTLYLMRLGHTCRNGRLGHDPVDYPDEIEE